MLNSLVGIYGNGVPVSTNSYESIATQTVGGAGASSVTFSSIPSTYTHLQIRFVALGGASYRLAAQCNSDTGANYSWHALQGSGSAASADASTSATSMKIGETIVTYPSVGVIDILDYADTNKYKTIKALEGFDANGSGYVQFFSGSWRSTAAISSLTLGTLVSGSMNQYSTFALYGIKA